jgi:hypothetical protein
MILDENILSIDRSDYTKFLKAYVKLAHTLNYYDPVVIKEISSYCRKNIQSLYPHELEYISKSNLPLRYETDLRYFRNISSGTTGHKVAYNIWQDTYQPIEAENHYKLVSHEYGISDPKVLYLLRDTIHNDRSAIFYEYRSNNPVLSHGFGKHSRIHHAYATPLLISDYLRYYTLVIEYAIKNQIDIILASGSTIASIAYVSYKLGINEKICKLMSNTNSAVDRSKLNYLKNNGMIDHWCDHMRCWDGGATFITCKYGTNHLLDGLSWCQSIDGKLISDDYFSVAFPFFRYWNGDYAEISQEYELCQCGRYFRKFIFNQPRGRSIPYTDKTRLDYISSEITDIVRIETIGNVIRYFTSSPVKLSLRQQVRDSVPNHLVLFEVEEWILKPS